MKPRALDLFSCSGGAARGLQLAGFHVTCVDINPQPNCVGDEFIQADALEVMQDLDFLRSFDYRRASPPCQAGCTLTAGTNKGREYPQLIPQTRAAFEAAGGPWEIENVVGAPIRRDLMLCGEMFGLGVIRHRLFEVGGWMPMQPHHPKHRGRVAGMRHGEWFTGPYFAVYGDGGGKGTVAQWQQAMGIDWTTDRKELAEAIPPAYSEWIGNAVTSQLFAGAAVLRSGAMWPAVLREGPLPEALPILEKAGQIS